MNISQVRDAIITEIKSQVGVLNDHVEGHGGRFNLDEVKRFSTRSPSVLVACLGIASATADSAGETEALCRWVAFVVTTDKKGVSRDAGALAIVSALLPIIPDNDWGLDMSVPKNIRADNLYSTNLDKTGIAMWAVTWDQMVALGGIDESTLDLFELMHVDWDLADPDGTYEAVDDDSLPQT